MKRISLFVALGLYFAAASAGQSLNIDIGEVGNGPPATYGAVGLPGVWNSLPALHGTTHNNLLDLDGQPTGVSLLQIGGMENLSVNDPAITGDDATLMDDFLITFSAGLESCIFLDGLEAGDYEVLIYARMPDPAVDSYTSVDQEDGFPHYEVGGIWTGSHQEMVSFSRHFATVGPDGSLDLHSGIVPQADPQMGAALNGLQLMLNSQVFRDGFENGTTDAWNG